MRHFWSTSTLNEYSGTHTLISNTYSTIQLQYIHIFVSWSNGTSWRSFFLLSRCRLFVVVVVVLFVAFFLNLKTALISVAFLKFNLTNQFLFFLHCCCKQKPYIYVYIYIFNKHTRMCLWCVGFFIFNFFYYFYIFLFESEIENDGAKKLMALAYFFIYFKKKGTTTSTKINDLSVMEKGEKRKIDRTKKNEKRERENYSVRTI